MSKKIFKNIFKKSTKKCKDEWLSVHRQSKQKIEKHICTEKKIVQPQGQRYV